MSKPKIHRIFIYGSLKKGFKFHETYLAGDLSEPQGKALASLEYSLYDNGMAHMIREKTDVQAKGEVYLVDEDVLKELDNFEGHPVVYKREMIDIVDENGNEFTAWAYLRPKHFQGKAVAWKVEEYV